MGARWPAIAFQSIFLAANVAFLLAGRNDTSIIVSVSVIVFLFTIQSMSKNLRFMYLFPVKDVKDKETQETVRIPAPGWDTWILKGLLILSVLFFLIGATGSGPLAFAIITLGIGFPILWDKKIAEHNRARIESRVVEKYDELKAKDGGNSE